MTLSKFEKNVGCSKRMRKSYVFIETSFGYTELALEELIKIDYVAKCSKLYGMYDIVVEIEAQTVQKLNEANSKIKSLTNGEVHDYYASKIRKVMILICL